VGKLDELSEHSFVFLCLTTVFLLARVVFGWSYVDWFGVIGFQIVSFTRTLPDLFL